MTLPMGAAFVAAGIALAQSAPSAENGTIVMYRQAKLMGFAVACPIRYKGQELVELGRGKYAEWRVAPGDYILGNKTSSLEVRVAPGQTRYVRCSLKTGMFAARADLQIVDETEFAAHRADYEKKEVAEPGTVAPSAPSPEK